MSFADPCNAEGHHLQLAAPVAGLASNALGMVQTHLQTTSAFFLCAEVTLAPCQRVLDSCLCWLQAGMKPNVPWSVADPDP